MKKKTKLAVALLKAKEWAFENLSGKKVYHKGIKKYIYFNKSGIKHAIYAKTYAEKIQLIYNAKELLKTSTLFEIKEDKAGRADIKKVYSFVNNWKYKNKEYFIYLIVRETNEGRFYYDHGIVKEKP